MAQSWEEWSDGCTEEDIIAMKKASSKNFWKWLAISLIPVIGFFTIGFALFCYNTNVYVKSRGRSNGSNLLRLIFLIWGLFLIAIIEVNVLAKSVKAGNKILGFDKL